jgi:hypothetical protein|tara:strand:+ start:2491 stop:2727 length:237 start_codon:yes stop_codon:yes gene_type:complete
MDEKQIRPYTLEEEKILREGLSDIKVTYENVAEIEIEEPFKDLSIQGDNSLPQDKTEEEIIRDTENDPFKGTSIEGKD